MFSKLRLESIEKTVNWIVLEDFTMLSSLGPIIVPQGFKTDLASVPGMLQGYITNDAPYIKEASVIHDYLYTFGNKYSFTKKQADYLLLEGMRYLGASDEKCNLVLTALEKYGSFYFMTNH